jgi:hypothetical protein
MVLVFNWMLFQSLNETILNVLQLNSFLHRWLMPTHQRMLQFGAQWTAAAFPASLIPFLVSTADCSN